MLTKDLKLSSFSQRSNRNIYSPERDDRGIRTSNAQRSIREYKQKFEYEFEDEFRKIVRNHKKAEKYMAPLAFPIKEFEWRRRNGMQFSEVSTPKSSL